MNGTHVKQFCPPRQWPCCPGEDEDDDDDEDDHDKKDRQGKKVPEAARAQEHLSVVGNSFNGFFLWMCCGTHGGVHARGDVGL